MSGPLVTDRRARDDGHVDVEQLRADRAAIEHAARNLRDLTIADQYAGLAQPVKGFALVLMLDELGRHARDLNDDVRRQAVESARTLVNDRSAR